MFTSYYFISLLLLELVLSPGFTLKCYICENEGKGTCFRPIENNMTGVECGIKEGKKVARIHYCSSYIMQTKKGQRKVERACVDAELSDGYCSLIKSTAKSAKAKMTKCSVCDEDLCNSSLALWSSVYLLYLSFSTIYIVYKFLIK